MCGGGYATIDTAAQPFTDGCGDVTLWGCCGLLGTLQSSASTRPANTHLSPPQGWEETPSVFVIHTGRRGNADKNGDGLPYGAQVQAATVAYGSVRINVVPYSSARFYLCSNDSVQFHSSRLVPSSSLRSRVLYTSVHLRSIPFPTVLLIPFTSVGFH